MNPPKTLQHYATQIARHLKKNQPPPLNEAMAAHLDTHPEEVLDTLYSMVECLRSGVDQNDSLIRAYCFLLGIQLEYIRYRVDRQYDWARDLVAKFQHEAAKLARSGDLPEPMLTEIAVALREAKLEPDPELFAAMSDVMEAHARPEAAPSDLDELLPQFAREFEGDEFEAAHFIAEFTYAMPSEVSVALASAMTICDFEVLRNAAPLLVLDERQAVRKGIAGTLVQNAEALTPESLRRLIAIRSWLPEEERATVDKIVKTARRKGVEPASWQSGEAIEAHSSAIDGSGAQGFLIISKAGRKYRLSSILTRLRSGVVDAWSSKEPESKRQINRQLSMASEQTELKPVSREYLDRSVRHHLDASCRNHRIPPVGLLEVAEVLGASDWRPDRLDPAATIEHLFEALPAEFKDPAAIARSLKESGDWSQLSGITESWFEDDQEIADLLSKSRARRLETLTRRVLAEVIEARREKWAEHLLWTALWLKETGKNKLWINFLLVARALHQGHPLKDIPLLGQIAERTVMVLSGNG